VVGYLWRSGYGLRRIQVDRASQVWYYRNIVEGYKIPIVGVENRTSS
jgi:hypothetical protein